MPCVATSIPWLRAFATPSDFNPPARKAARARNTKAVIEMTTIISTRVNPDSRGARAGWCTTSVLRRTDSKICRRPTRNYRAVSPVRPGQQCRAVSRIMGRSARAAVTTALPGPGDEAQTISTSTALQRRPASTAQSRGVALGSWCPTSRRSWVRSPQRPPPGVFPHLRQALYAAQRSVRR